MSPDDYEECSYRGCEKPVEGKIQWIDEEDPISYCSNHIEQAQAQWPDMVEVLDE